MQLFQIPDAAEGIDRLGFAPDGRALAARTRHGGWVIDTAAGAVRRLWAERVEGGSVECRLGVGFTPDGTGVIAQTDQADPSSRAVRVYDVETGAVRREFQPRTIVYSGGVEFGPRGRVVYVIVERRGNEIVRWNPVTGVSQPAFGRHGGGRLVRLAVSADGDWVAGTNSYEVRVWDLRAGRRPARATRCFRLPYEFGYGPPLALSSDGSYLSVGGRQLGVWDVRSAADDPAHLARGRFGDVTFSPNRSLLLHGCEADAVFRDPTTGAEVGRLCWGTGRIKVVAFAPDGLRCAAGGEDGKVVVWDVDS